MKTKTSKALGFFSGLFLVIAVALLALYLSQSFTAWSVLIGFAPS